jgi:hypothetical protein
LSMVKARVKSDVIAAELAEVLGINDNTMLLTTPPLDADRADKCIRAGGYVYYEFGAGDWFYSMTPRPRG